MATLKKTVNETYYWSLDRIYELCSRDDFEEVVNGDALRQEFDEWINCLLYTSPSPRDRTRSRMPSSA